MIPRLHKRGTSFKGACSYILHDPGKDTTDRILWVDSRNVASDPEHAWFEMFAVARDQAELKRQAGKDARGRKNTAPVLHYTLSWAAGENPTMEHMRETALASLKAMGLDKHQVLMAAHGDKDHLHVHLVANTIDPQTGITAPLKYTKERLSRWAEAYEREHGIHCEQRIQNNAERERLAKERRIHVDAALMPGEQPHARARMPYVPVKHRAPNRKQWFERKDLSDRMKRLRLEMELRHKVARNATWDRQVQARSETYKTMRAALDNAREHVTKEFKPQWRDLYRHQKGELKFLATAPLLERAVFVFLNSERLGHGRPLTFRQKFNLITKPGKLLDALERAHGRERRFLAQMEKATAQPLTAKILDNYAKKRDGLISQQTDERQAERQVQFAATRSITLEHAKASLSAERPAPEPIVEDRPFMRVEPLVAAPPEMSKETEAPHISGDFRQAASPASQPLSRADQIKREMAEWRKRNEGNDYGREIDGP